MAQAPAGFGQYAHSNQPVHHVLYLYAALGRPARTQFWVRRVCTELYGPDRFPGDEDNGEMAAWYVLSSLGIFPLCPGHPSYVFGSPLFPKATIPSPGGRDEPLTITAASAVSAAAGGEGEPRSDLRREEVAAPSPAPFVARIQLRGEAVRRLFVTHEELLRGGDLAFETTREEERMPRVEDEDQALLPFSLSTDEKKAVEKL